MHLETLTFLPAMGWSIDPLPQRDSDRTLVVVFGASSFLDAPAPIIDLVKAYPNSHFLGCSTSGEIHGESIQDDSLTVAIAEFEESRLATASAEVASSAASFNAGRDIARSLLRDDLRAVLVMSDGLGVNGSELVRGINSVLPPSVVVTGGLAGDGDRFRRTWVLTRGEPKQGIVSAVGLYGDHVRIGHGSRGGWDRFGPERRVTRSVGNVLYELDGKPALDLYKTYLGDRAAGLPATALLFPLALRSAPEDTKLLVRTILAVDEQAQSMTFAGDIPQGSLAQLMKANFERLIDGASQAAQYAQMGASSGKPGAVLSIAISCVGRRLILGERAEEEIAAAIEELPAGTKQVGFYSYGEISPFATGHCDLLNQTMTLTTITES
jgi:hypothetical protein